MACSDAERAGEHARVLKVTEKQALLEETALRMTSGCQKHQDSSPSQAGPCTEPAHASDMRWGRIEESSICGVINTPPQESIQLCCAWDRHKGHTALAMSKLGYTEAN